MPNGTAVAFKWNAARLKSLLLCPRQFSYAFVDGIPSVPTAPRAFGGAMHETLRLACEHQMATGVLPSVQEMEAILNGLWSAALETESPYFGPRHPTLEGYEALGFQMLSAFHRDYAMKPPPLAVELAFDISIGGQNLVGFVDRVDEGEQGVVVVDYKSGQKKPSPNEAANDVQLTISALAVRQTLGLAVESVEYRFLRDGRHIQTNREESAFDWLGEALIFAEDMRERGKFLPRPGFWCRFCDYRELCAAQGIEVSVSGARGGDANGLSH